MSGCCHFGAIFSCCVAQMQIICSWKKTQGICSNSFKIRENASDIWKDQLSIAMCLLRSTRCAYYQTGKGSLSNNKTSNNLQSSLPLILFSQRDVGELCRRNSGRIWDPRIPGGRWAVGGGCSGSHQWAVRPMAAMRTQLLLLTLLIGIANGQRRPPQVRLAVLSILYDQCRRTRTMVEAIGCQDAPRHHQEDAADNQIWAGTLDSFHFQGERLPSSTLTREMR